MTNDELKKILLAAIASPERARNDAGEVESRPLDEIIDALKFVSKMDAASSPNPLKYIKQVPIDYPDGWR
jgi:hypothetical protein